MPYIFSTYCSQCHIYDELALKTDLVGCVRTFFSKGMISVGGGNHSFRSNNPVTLWITPSGYPRSHLSPEDLVLIDLDGNILQGNLKPSIEVPFHTEIYKARSDINGICHTHNPYTQGFFLSSKLTCLQEGIYTLSKPPPIQFPKQLGTTPIIIEYRQLGSRALGKIVGKASNLSLFKPCGVIVLINHGVIGIGRCIHEARFLVDLIEEWARCLAILARDAHLMKADYTQIS